MKKPVRERAICTIDGCLRQVAVISRGWCIVHYRRWTRHGDPAVLLINKVGRGEPMRWLLAHLDYSGPDCLQWPFNRCTRSGTAQMSIKRRTVNPARVICEKLYGPPPSPQHEAAHSCGNGHLACVHPKHVRWATHLENEADKIAHGRIRRGEAHGNAKLTEQDVRLIRASKGVSRIAARKFGVSPSLVRLIRKRKSWAHVQ